MMSKSTTKPAENPKAAVRFAEGTGWVAFVEIPKGGKWVRFQTGHLMSPLAAMQFLAESLAYYIVHPREFKPTKAESSPKTDRVQA